MNIGVRTVFYVIHQMGQHGNISIISTLILLQSLEMWLGLCGDGFNPYTLSSRFYSIWPVVVTPYNLRPEMMMITTTMTLTMMMMQMIDCL